MEKKNRRKRRRFTYSPMMYAAIAAVTVSVLILLIYCFSVKVDIQLKGGDGPVTLVYGKDTYQEQGATATANGKPVDVTIEGSVNHLKLGTYKITYRARYLWVNASVQREVHVVDTTAPVIALTSDPAYFVKPGEVYQEEGFAAHDDYDGDITDKVERIVSAETVTYKVQDSSGNETTIVRPIRYEDTSAPQIILKGEVKLTIHAGGTYTEPGFTATDDVDGDITDRVQVEGSVDTYRAGTYNIIYKVSDSFGNETQVTRTVTVKPIQQPDIITPNGKVIYLTFDDGPGVYTQKLLDILEKYNVKATFFVVNTGYNMKTLLNNIVNGGHSIGIHSVSHVYSEVYASEEAFFKDLYGMQEIIENYTGVKTMLMRFPGGSSNPISKKYCEGIMTRLTQAVQDQGFRYFDWHIDSRDWEVKDADKTYENIISGIQGKDSVVVLQHDIHSTSVDAVERVIIWGLQNGYTFLPLTTSSPTCHHTVNN